MRRRNYKIKDVFLGAIMGQISFPVLIMSSTAALLGKKTGFQVTVKGKTGTLPFWKLWPWLVMMFVMFFAIIAGVLRFQENPYAIGVNIIWSVYHLAILLCVFRLNKSPHIAIPSILTYA